MALDFNSVERPFRKLRKSLKGFSESPMPEDVHALRTKTRRVEAIVQALQLERNAVGSDLLECLTPIRKAAGDVRDMDVLVGLSSSLKPGGEDQCLVQLLEYLGRRRAKDAAKLHKAIVARQRDTRYYLKECVKFIEDAISSSKTNIPNGQQAPINAMAVSLQIEAELRDWPKLTAKNIHPYRLKVKELRYILQLAESSNSKFIEALGKVKDQIGAWHDWTELTAISKQILTHGPACQLSRQILRARTELVKALGVANEMRTSYLNKVTTRYAGKKSSKSSPVPMNASLIGATSRLAG
jgi:CHAD domain-containing protein